MKIYSEKKWTIFFLIQQFTQKITRKSHLKRYELRMGKDEFSTITSAGWKGINLGKQRIEQYYIVQLWMIRDERLSGTELISQRARSRSCDIKSAATLFKTGFFPLETSDPSIGEMALFHTVGSNKP